MVRYRIQEHRYTKFETLRSGGTVSENDYDLNKTESIEIREALFSHMRDESKRHNSNETG